MALLPGEPAGTVSTRTAGVVEFLAVLSWRHADEMPTESLVPVLSGFDEDGARFLLSETKDSALAIRRVSGRILALTEEDLGVALDAALRAVSELAALSEAVLETRAVRRCAPRDTPVRLRDRLARDLSEAGFEVCFAPAWETVTGADVSVGARGMREELEEFLTRKPDWRISASHQ